MSSERADQPATPDNPNRIPGKTLAAQREAMGWTVEQVADQLKLHVRQVTALEAGDYAKLPSPAVTRGFVRAYAKLVRLDPAPLVAQIEMDVPPTPDNSATVARRASPTSFSGSRFPSNGKRSALPVGLMAGAVVAIAAAAAAAAWHFGVLPHRGVEAETAPVSAAAPAGSPAEPVSGTAAAGNAVETLQNPSVPLISVPSPNAAPAAGAPSNATPSGAAPSTAAPSGATPAATPAAGRPQAQAQPATPVGAAAAAAQPTTRTAAVAPTAGPNPLVLNVRADSWIEVRPAKGGAPLLSRLVKAGAVETVNVDQPVRVTVGNPGGVSATLRGNPVALPEVPGKTLARVNLQ